MSIAQSNNLFVVEDAAHYEKLLPLYEKVIQFLPVSSYASVNGHLFAIPVENQEFFSHEHF